MFLGEFRSASAAEPHEDGKNLLAAAGLIPPSSTFLSVRAKTVFSRCGLAFKPFDKDVATLIANARNEYLHGGSASFAPIPEAAWWPSFWGQVSILVHALDFEISDFVGEQRVPMVEAHLDQNKKNITDRANMRIERARQLYLQAQAATLTAAQLAEWEARKRHLPAYLEKSSEDRVPCPACGNSTSTWLTGQDIEDTDVVYEQISQDDFDVIVTLTIGTEYFACETCGLELDGPEIIDGAGLPSDFTTAGDASDVFEAEYGND